TEALADDGAVVGPDPERRRDSEVARRDANDAAPVAAFGRGAVHRKVVQRGLDGPPVDLLRGHLRVASPRRFQGGKVVADGVRSPIPDSPEPLDGEGTVGKPPPTAGIWGGIRDDDGGDVVRFCGCGVPEELAA